MSYRDRDRGAVRRASVALPRFVARRSSAFFALPMLWLVTAPFDAAPQSARRWPDFTLGNFRRAARQPVRAALAVQLGRSWPPGTMVWSRSCRRARRVRAEPGADPRPRRAPLPAAAAVVDRHRHGGDGADLPADVRAPPDRHGHRRDPRAHRRPAARGDLHPQGLHGHDAQVVRGVGAGVRGEPLQVAARTSSLPIVRPGLATIAVWAVVQRVGQLPHAVPAAPHRRRSSRPAWSCTPSTPRAGSRTSR